MFGINIQFQILFYKELLGLMSSRGSSKKLMALRQLHLSPHFIYLVNSGELPKSARHCLQLWKDDVKIGQTRQLTVTPPQGSQKFSSLSFEKIRFVFDVEALFEQDSQSTIKLKLTQIDRNQERVKDEFRLHILYYNYQYSSSNFIKQKQNSIGKINHYIFNYSFSAIYGDPLSTLLFRKNQHQNHQQHNGEGNNKKLKYGEIIKDENKNQFFDTIFMLESVTLKGLSLPISQKSEETTEAPSKISDRSTFFEDAIEDGNSSAVATKYVDQDSSIGDIEYPREISLVKKDLLYWVVLILGAVSIYLLMHPIKKL